MNEHLSAIIKYVEEAKGLDLLEVLEGDLKVLQKVDAKVLTLKITDVEKVLFRTDDDGQAFIQVNLVSGSKLLMTQTLVGFRPSQRLGLDMTKLPNVVTTPDLLGVIEALEDTLHEAASQEELDVLKKLFYSVLDGAEDIGFDLSTEKSWLRQINRSGVKASA